MPQVRIRDRNQLTIPMSITQAAGLAPNDTLDVNYINGVITLIPVGGKVKKLSFLDFVGSAKGTWGKSDEAINKTIRNARDSWER